jgi:phytoene dehydrogenase-like protein
VSSNGEGWDAVVIGGGHNGLVCAAYLARGGLRTLLLERRIEVGGAAATSELAPGVRVPRFAHTVGRIATTVVRDLDLTRHGLRLVQPAARVTSIRPDRPPITLWSDAARTATDVRAVSSRDAHAWGAFEQEVAALTSILEPLMGAAPPDPAGPSSDVLGGAIRAAYRYNRSEGRHGRELTRVLPQSIADWTEDRFADDGLRALLATRGVRYARFGPRDAGSAAHFLTDSIGLGGAAGETVYARGGPGALARSLAAAATVAGVTIRTSAEAAAIRDRDERVVGVALTDGDEVAARVVVSGLDPRSTLLGLVDPATLGPELGWEVDNVRDRGVTAKVNLGLRGLPAFHGFDDGSSASRLRGRLVVAPSLRYLDAAADAAKYGQPSDQPWLEATIPSLVDPLLINDDGPIRHVMSVVAQSAPRDLREGDWDSQGEALGDRVVDVLDGVAPGFRDLVVAREVLTPLDIERELGTSGGHPMHLEPALDQWFAWRPLFGLAAYRMPLAGLYLCGAGAHPGGGITGLPGRNAARKVLADLKPRRRRSLGR